MSGESFKMVEDEENKEEALYNCRMIVTHINFQESSIRVTQDD